ncbi:hypothetical protein [Aquisphaera insulae]|uniref:hypothetical protein n=1 Tax=Aquisphaera insulae TaxID=2712864 RepID=UPI0013EBC26A|nr:hypothetical protein [Aquisphaera insulae]
MTSDPPEVSLKTRWLLYAGAWMAAYLGRLFIPPLLAGTVPGRDAVLIYTMFSWMFPAGLIAWFDSGSPDRPGNIMWIVLIWIAYLVHGIFTLRARTRMGFYGLLLILAIVLVINVAGCERIHLNARSFG